MPNFLYPPGPRNHFPGQLLRRFWKDPLTFLTKTREQYGDLCSFSFGRQPIYLLHDPADIHAVLVTHQHLFKKSQRTEYMKRVIGLNLLTSEAEVHHRRRRLLMPAFHSERLKSYAEQMIQDTMACRQRWDTATSKPLLVDIHTEMLELTSAIVGKTLFNVELTNEIVDIRNALQEITPIFRTLSLPFGEWLMHLPLPAHRRYEHARRRLDEIFKTLIQHHAPENEDKGDLLSMLLQARDEKGKPMSAQEILDETKGIFLAGHETTASALTYLWILLAQNPPAEKKLHQELQTVLKGRTPTYTDFPLLRYTRAVFAESLRLYPPSWLLARQILEDYPLKTYTIPKGSLLFMSPWSLHRHPSYFPNPEQFIPERWLQDSDDTHTRSAYFPFGAGARGCIGEGFAWMEGVLLIATLAQAWCFRLPADFQLRLEAFITLRPKGAPCRMQLERRS